ncbi:uncharacterized protein [Physcomitrium patens]|uniref:HMA domain-containing protein n=1 Tax=Physcomitrium patens TaxID=3218 RepID=A0A2K1JZN5_PHYPA|nr:copper transport protein CCH-like [Physcomitrium patens]PNR46980.1 hypothetical protein PHYPA_014100 [Physcomitrium patens]|eukprot:XP_024385977.1 copper transport protein CCH-like [Physcomitrella patens]
MSQTVVMNVAMVCEGCAISVKKTLKKIPGVTSYAVNFKEKKATVVGNVDPEDVVRRVSKSGKAATLVSATPTPPPPDPPKEDAKPEAPPAKKKEGKGAFVSLRQKMPNLRPKMPDVKLPKSVAIAMAKMPDCRNLPKTLPDCRNMPRMFNQAMDNFRAKGVFFAADNMTDSD